MLCAGMITNEKHPKIRDAFLVWFLIVLGWVDLMGSFVIAEYFP